MSKRRRNKGGLTPPKAPPRPGRRSARQDTPASPLAGEGRGGGARSRDAGGASAPAPTPGPRRIAPTDPALRPRFWETVPLAGMTATEWEALCDGCGKCCLLKLEDADTGRVHYTDVTCRLYDCRTRACGQYALRRMFVPGCVVLSPDNIDEAAGWMPASCAYRRLHEGRGLAPWHPLVSGDPASVARAGQALTFPTVPEYEVPEEDLEDHVIDHDLLTDDGDTP